MKLNQPISILREMYDADRLPEYNWEVDFLLQLYFGPKEVRYIAEITYGNMQERLEKEYFAQ